jgi:hypothetical protein
MGPYRLLESTSQRSNEQTLSLGNRAFPHKAYQTAKPKSA